MAKGKFGTAINCIDGRVQLPVIKWITQKYNLDYVDMITKPGPDLVVSDPHHKKIESVRTRVEVSVNKHGSKIVFITGHHDCAGNPVSKQIHLQQIEKSLETIKSWKIPGVEKIVGLWLDENWQVEKIKEILPV